MRKFLGLTLVMALAFLLFVPFANASDEQDLQVYFIQGDATYATSTVVNATTTIVPGKSRILGYQASAITAGTGTIAASLHDATTVAGANSTATVQFAEPTESNTTSEPKWFKYPKPLAKGLVVKQTPGTNVAIFYENSLPL